MVLCERDQAIEGVGLGDPAVVVEETLEHRDGGAQRLRAELEPGHEETDVPADLGQLRARQALEDLELVAREDPRAAAARLLEGIDRAHRHERIGVADRLPQLLGPGRMLLDLARDGVRLADRLSSTAAEPPDEARVAGHAANVPAGNEADRADSGTCRTLEAMSYAKKNLRDVKDFAAEQGFSAHQEARFPRRDLGAEQTGMHFLTVKPGQREAFAHRHRSAEEIYVVIDGAGRVKLDDELVELAPLDAVRVSPGVTRRIEAGPDGLQILIFGPHVESDVEMVEDFWSE